ncbi:MAG TPA: hypothetical protein VMK12_01520 [Anaeromyxobacteraceae bacterium]|nr:hypothetical protein [Anaeromyxobacteraceae bacterium]
MASRNWQCARGTPKIPERNTLFREVFERFDFKSSMTARFAIACKNACGIDGHLSSNATPTWRAFEAVEHHAFGKRGRPWFKRQRSTRLG